MASPGHLGWSGAGPSRGVPGCPRHAPPPPGPPRATPMGWKYSKNMSFLVNPSAPKCDHTGSGNGDIRCQMAHWSGRMAPSSPRLAGSCTWSLQCTVFGAMSNAQFNAVKWLPGPFGLDWGRVEPGRPRVCGTPPRVAPGGCRAFRAITLSQCLLHLRFTKFDASAPCQVRCICALPCRST